MSQFLKNFVSSARQTSNNGLTSRSLLAFLKEANALNPVVSGGCRLLKKADGSLHLSANGRASVVILFQDGTENFLPCSAGLTADLMSAAQPLAILAECSVLETADGKGWLTRNGRQEDGI